MTYLKVIIICFVSLIFCCNKAYSQKDNLEASAKFFNAGSAYKQEDYKKAIILYEEILGDGLASGELYYNLGNSYFKIGNSGKALLNYERARMLIPRDSDLESNYYYAISLIDERQAAVKQPLIHRFIHGYLDSITLDELTVIAFVLFILMGITYLSCLFLKCSSKILYSSIIVLGFLSASHTFLLWDKIHYEKNLAIVLTKTDSKFEPIDGATIHFELPEGGKVKIIKEKEDWIKVKRADGKEGWSEKEMLEKIQGN